MKRYIKDNKVYTTPITIKKKEEVEEEIINDNGEKEIVKKVVDVQTITNVEKLILEAGYEIYTPPKVPLEILIDRSNRKINTYTDNKILNDFVWKNHGFYLSMENQFNFKNLYDLRSVREYPITIKTKDGFTTLKSSEEVENFYLAGVMFIEKCLTEGWEKKRLAEEKIRSEYK